MAIFGYFVYLVFCFVVTFFCCVFLYMGGEEFSSPICKKGSGFAVLLFIGIIALVWSGAYHWFPFEVRVR